MSQAAKQTQVTRERIMQDLWAARNAQALMAGTELDFFTHINNGKHTAKEIARAAKASERGTRRILDALVGLGYLSKKDNNYYLEPVSERFLVRGQPTYLGPMVNETKMVW